MTCPVCKKEGKLVSGVVDGEYISKRCEKCFGKNQPKTTPHSRYAEYSRERQREDYQKEIAQPWDGFKPSRAFIKAYPDKAKEYFSKKELNEYS